MSACIADRLAMVSSRLSPLAVLLRANALAAQQRHLLDVAVVDAEEGAGGVQDLRQHRARQALDGQQVDQLAVPVELGIAARQH